MPSCAEHSQDPEAIQYLADKAAAMKKSAEMDPFDATDGSGPYVDEDGYEFEAFVGDGAPATAAGATAPSGWDKVLDGDMIDGPVEFFKPPPGPVADFSRTNGDE